MGGVPGSLNGERFLVIRNGIAGSLIFEVRPQPAESVESFPTINNLESRRCGESLSRQARWVTRLPRVWLGGGTR